MSHDTHEEHTHGAHSEAGHEHHDAGHGHHEAGHGHHAGEKPNGNSPVVISFKSGFWLIIILVGLFVAALNFIKAESGGEGEEHGAKHEMTEHGGGHEANEHKEVAEPHEAAPAAEGATEAAAPKEGETAPAAETAAPAAPAEGH